MFRECKECRITKPITDFNKHPLGVDGYMSTCKECKRVYQRQRDKDFAETMKQLFFDLKDNKPCLVCNRAFPHYVMQFKRMEPGPKISSIGSLKQLYRELPKCRLMSANCLSINAYPIEYTQKTELQIWLAEYKESHPCTDCNKFFHYRAMGFHHIDPAKKEYQISKSGTIARAISEIEKCALLCLNCHMEREWGLNGLSKQRFELYNEEVNETT